jgi:tRNA pseudouridine13 synthase
LFLSAARSWIYNQIVSERIAQGCFDHFILGDIAEQDGELIHVDESNITALNEKLAVGEVAITAALAGDNALPLSSAALELEQRHLDNEPDMMKLIQNNRMRHARRAINILPSNMTWKTKDNTVIVSFSLPAGSFATSIIREVAKEIPHERVFD